MPICTKCPLVKYLVLYLCPSCSILGLSSSVRLNYKEAQGSWWPHAPVITSHWSTLLSVTTRSSEGGDVICDIMMVTLTTWNTTQRDSRKCKYWGYVVNFADLGKCPFQLFLIFSLWLWWWQSFSKSLGQTLQRVLRSVFRIPTASTPVCIRWHYVFNKIQTLYISLSRFSNLNSHPVGLFAKCGPCQGVSVSQIGRGPSNLASQNHYILVVQTLEDLRPLMSTGLPALGLPPTEPMNIESMQFAQGAPPVIVQASFSNVTVRGLSTFITDYIEVDPVTRWELQIHIVT